MKALIRRALQYEPLRESLIAREAVTTLRLEHPDRPACSQWQGDLIWQLITRHGYTRCLETGFGTGSTALYMLQAAAAKKGTLLSLDWSPRNFNRIGKASIASQGLADRHELIERQSHLVMADLLLKERQFDFVFLDGWKTFDYLAYECFIVNRLLDVGGTLMFDDTYLPSVQKAISLLIRHYDYEELDYTTYNETRSMRLREVLTTKRLTRPDRALRKTKGVEDQRPTTDWTWFAPF